jgi:hypothetical protein
MSEVSNAIKISLLYGLIVVIAHVALKNHIRETFGNDISLLPPSAPGPVGGPGGPQVGAEEDPAGAGGGGSGVRPAPTTGYTGPGGGIPPPGGGNGNTEDDFMRFIMGDDPRPPRPAPRDADGAPAADYTYPQPAPTVPTLRAPAMQRLDVSQCDQLDVSSMVIGKYQNESAMCGGTFFEGLQGFNPGDVPFCTLE